MKTTLHIGGRVMVEPERNAARQGRIMSEPAETAPRMLLEPEMNMERPPRSPALRSGGARRRPGTSPGRSCTSSRA